MRLEDVILKIPGPVVKGFAIGTPAAFSIFGLYETFKYLNNGESGKALIAGICSMLCAYVVGYQMKRKF